MARNPSRVFSVSSLLFSTQISKSKSHNLKLKIQNLKFKIQNSNTKIQNF